MTSMVRSGALGALTIACIALFSGAAIASDDAARNKRAAKDCVRGTFKDY